MGKIYDSVPWTWLSLFVILKAFPKGMLSWSWRFFCFSLDPTLQHPPTPPSDNIDWKSKCVQLQEIVAQHQDKLENCQKEIDVQKNDFRYGLFELSALGYYADCRRIFDRRIIYTMQNRRKILRNSKSKKSMEIDKIDINRQNGQISTKWTIFDKNG